MNHIEKMISNTRGKRLDIKKRYLFVSKYDEWLKGVESHVKCIGDGEKFFTDTDKKGVIRAFFKNEKVGVWGGVPEHGYYLASSKLPMSGNEIW